jgi:nucleoid-associated protein YgaU
MGVFDFLKEVGATILGIKGNEAKDIKQLLERELSTRIKDLQVEFKNGQVTLFGSCDTIATKEKAVLLAGNIKGVEKVFDEQLTAPPAEEVTEFYTVRSGDTLSKIAKQFYGDAGKYPGIFEANKEVIKDPNLIYPVQMIRIPKISGINDEQVYTVQSGDTLSKIAQHFYGAANKYTVIFEANRDTLKDPNVIHPGQNLRIPKL